ncbi:uncharacterized protein C8Q71DRAFT_698948 [Rhodofomes roseus]|uniref:GYF domain-containing protein n=1 Tax=Rhodofomes roseus TaxID=34475 RepID=A0A4Y9YMY1_9APHY|nr:uncharacterized protein C8Q71DRAFT_698948 [Rhodofomes roseus]KAH9843068.1 hypothetical protein C8Q71DRAFT_698948 [Rhodofomes roseus]TFY63290.1 hypothetical protein EVJ58_g3340 [Rhodofomes roseus]
MSAAARPPRKRAATSSDDVPGPSKGPQKKTRFVEPKDDPVNFAEEVDASLETRQRRGRVKTEGYESDSSDDGEGVVPSRRPGADKADEDEDMFAMGEKEEKAEESGKKETKFLRLGDIEGQEFNEQNSDQSESEEPDDQDAAERNKAGMGYELSSFNMREEMEEGKFAEDGTYVRTFDPHAAHDRWMEGLDEEEIKKTRRNHRLREKEQKEKQKAEEEEMRQLGGRPQIEKELVGMLKKGETVLEALQRLGAQAKKSGASKRNGKPNNKRKGDLAEDPMQVDKAPKAPSEIDHITHLASTLMGFGDTDVYSKTYEELVRSVRSSGIVDSSWMPPSADVRYEYRWAVPDSSGQDGQVFGPFGEEEIKAWYKAGYFGAAGEKVQVRRVAGEWGTWDAVVT